MYGNQDDLTQSEVWVFFIIWYIFTCITNGSNTPAGLFLPGMILGCGLGRILGDVFYDAGFLTDAELKPAYSNFIVISAAAVLAGYTRLTYSLAVIMMETAQTMNLFVPMFFAVAISYKVGEQFTRGLYVRGLRGKQIPMLMDVIPHVVENINAS